MCLSSIDKNIESPTDKVIKAWKVFHVVEGRLRNQYQKRGRNRPRGKWLRATARPYLHAWKSGGHYRTGFHAWALRKTALKWKFSDEVLIQVQLRKVRTWGRQGRRRVYVADEMLIPKGDK